MPHLTDRRYKALVERLINHEVQVDGNGNLVEIDPVPILDPEDGTFHEERLKFFAQLRDRGDAYTALTNDQIGSYDPDLRHTRPSDYTAIAALFAAIDRDINHRHNFSTMVEVVRMMLKMEYEECEEKLREVCTAVRDARTLQDKDDAACSEYRLRFIHKTY